MRKFKTESKKLLDLMINSIYTNQEIFLRELISNASDAVDKLYFKSLTDSDIQFGKDELGIDLAFDKDARTITISDNGIGMTADELEKNLGTIAHSGSMEFKQEQKEAEGDDGKKKTDDVDIIGQFGVGFYSSFMVAKQVRVVTRAFGEDTAHQWESDGVEGYTISDAERAGHGTDIILTLKDDTDQEKYSDYLSEHRLKDLVHRYSNYVRYPIRMECTKSRQKPKPEDAGDDWKPEYEDYTEVDVLNSRVPIWKRRKSDVKPEEYNDFYKGTFHDFTDPARTISVHAEGALAYDVLMFIPSRAPYDLYSKDYEKGLALYSSNVMIMEKCADLLPDYYNFVHGVVDSQDLSLNISRETLQHNSQLRAISNKVEKKITGELEKMRDNEREDYEKFFENFGRGLKYGIYSTYGMKKDELGGLLLFHSAKQDKMVTLDEYLAAMPEGQDSIFYAVGESTERLGKLPVVRGVLDKGFDVLLCDQDVDEFCLMAMESYNDKPLKNVAGGDLGLETEDEKAAAEETAKANQGLFDSMKESLGDKVAKVSVSTRLADAPAGLTAEGPVSLEMEKMLAGAPDAGNMKANRVLEVNPEHPVFAALKAASDAGDTAKVASYTDILYNQALLMEGMPIDDPAAFAQEVAALMK